MKDIYFQTKKDNNTTKKKEKVKMIHKELNRKKK